MRAAIVLLGFGEPAAPTLAAVTSFLERIFLANARLEPATDPDVVARRTSAMAGRRAPELIEDYRRIGGSPLNAQATRQAGMLERELGRAGHDVVVRAAMQFTDPSIPAAAAEVAGRGVDRLIALSTYPLCGPSTTLPALEELRRSLDDLGWDVPVHEISGWHPDPAYTALRADGVRSFCAREGVELADPATRVVFAAHGTPIDYLAAGSRYDLYAADHCRRLAGALGLERYVLGFQNHANRPGVEWTRPDIERAIEGLDARRIVVVPVSFMQEHSETLADLDIALRGVATDRGLAFHRVPVPHDDPAFIDLLARLTAPFLAGGSRDDAGYGPCRCRSGAVCLNRSVERAEA